MLVKEYLKNCGKNYTSGATSLKARSSSTETNEQENLKIGFVCETIPTDRNRLRRTGRGKKIF